jgi:hypothetical protein
MSLSADLFALAQRVKLLEEAGVDEHKDEKLHRYYYGKGSLDYRDKLLDLVGSMSSKRTALDAFHLLLGTYPDPFPGP